MDYDADRITYTNQNLGAPGRENEVDDGGMSAVEAKRQLREFIRSYRDGNLFPYRDQVRYSTGRSPAIAEPPNLMRCVVLPPTFWA